MLTRRYDIDMVPGGVPLTLNITQNDIGLTTFVFAPFASHGELDLSALHSAIIEATKPDGYAIYHECTVNNDGTISYTIQEQLAAKAGRIYSKLVLLDANDNQVASQIILWIADESGVQDGAEISDSDMTALQEMMEALGGAQTIQNNLDELERKILAGTQEYAAYHLGLYIDSDGDISQVEEDE